MSVIRAGGSRWSSISAWLRGQTDDGLWRSAVETPRGAAALELSAVLVIVFAVIVAAVV